MLKMLRDYGLYLAWLIAVAGLIISLFASEVFNLPVCHLCWYQRVCLYPLAIILGIASFYEDRSIANYAIPLCVLGFLFALYQYLQQMIPGFAPINFCSTQGPSCTLIHFKLLGFITFPFLTLLATVVMTALLFIAKTKNK